MKISNFRGYSRTGEDCWSWEYMAVVDVTTGMLWWKKTEKRVIRRRFAELWFFVSDGEYLPSGAGFRMERAYKAQNGID